MNTTGTAPLSDADLGVLLLELDGAPDVQCTALVNDACPVAAVWVYVCPGCGWPNVFCQPHRQVVDRLEQRGTPVVCTPCGHRHPTPIPWRPL